MFDEGKVTWAEGSLELSVWSGFVCLYILGEWTCCYETSDKP